MKKRTLNQTWTLCLRMWRSIAKTKNGMDVIDLKQQWVEDNEIENLNGSNCFFCDYANSCSQCPGRLVDPDFRCENPEYNYEDKPVAFYKELLRLNRIRKTR